jgi:hypothetical protein
LIVVIGMKVEVWPGGGWGFGNKEEVGRVWKKERVPYV